jgi:hypothetical protein
VILAHAYLLTRKQNNKTNQFVRQGLMLDDRLLEKTVNL